MQNPPVMSTPRESFEKRMWLGLGTLVTLVGVALAGCDTLYADSVHAAPHAHATAPRAR